MTLIPETEPGNKFSDELRKQTAAVRFGFWKFGVSKSLSADQKVTAAAVFEAKGDALSASKKLLNVKHPKYQAVTKAIGRARTFWKVTTVWYPVKGVRLLRRDLIPNFETQMATYQTEIAEASVELEAAYGELKIAARERLGDLFNEYDYPDTLKAFFGFTWEFVNVEPPNYLKELNPKLYEEAKDRIQQRFEEAVSHAEEAFAGELQGLVTHLLDKLAGEEDGKPKVFRNSAVKNLSEFFDKFKSLNIGSNGELDALVSQAEAAIAGVDVKELRKDGALRSHVAGDLTKVKDLLDGMLVDRPSRKFRLEGDE